MRKGEPDGTSCANGFYRSRMMWQFIVKRLRMEGFLVFDFADRFKEGRVEMARWIAEGKLKYKEDTVKGLENAPKALIGLFSGANFGKQLVQVGDLPG